jgi:hypothetical protein
MIVSIPCKGSTFRVASPAPDALVRRFPVYAAPATESVRQLLQSSQALLRTDSAQATRLTGASAQPGAGLHGGHREELRYAGAASGRARPLRGTAEAGHYLEVAALAYSKQMKALGCRPARRATYSKTPYPRSWPRPWLRCARARNSSARKCRNCYRKTKRTAPQWPPCSRAAKRKYYWP